MATNSKELMDEISDQFLSCKICFENYKSPKTLACMHTFCEECLEQHLDAEQDRKYRFRVYVRTLSCPICRIKTEVPNGGVRKLPDNFLLSNLIDIFERRKQTNIKLPVCEICKPNGRYSSHQAISKCLECNKMLCRKCVNLHKSTKVTQSHSLFDTETEKDIQCKIHKEESVRFYCEPCEQCICILCTFQEHKDHEITSFSDGLAKYRNCMDTLLTDCRDRINDIKDHLDLIQTCESRVKDTEDLIRDTAINAISAIRKRERLMTQELKKHVGQETYDFIKQKQHLRDTLQTLQSTCDLTDIILKEPSIELLLLKKDIRSKLESLTQGRLMIPPYNLQQKVKFVPGILNFGFLEFDGRPIMKRDLMEQIGCPCSQCIVHKVDQETMTAPSEVTTKCPVTEASPVMKRNTHTDPLDGVGKGIQTRLPDLLEEGFSNNHPFSCDNTYSKGLPCDSPDRDTFDFQKDMNGNSDSVEMSEKHVFSGDSKENPEVCCQTDAQLLESLLTDCNFVFQYNISKVLPEKVDAETTMNSKVTGTGLDERDIAEWPKEFRTVGCDPICLTPVPPQQNWQREMDRSEDMKVVDYRRAYTSDKPTTDNVQPTVSTARIFTERVEMKDASVSTVFTNANPLDKGCTTEPVSTADAAVIAKVSVREIGILKRPHTITRATVTIPKNVKTTATETDIVTEEVAICQQNNWHNTDPVSMSSSKRIARDVDVTCGSDAHTQYQDRGTSPVRLPLLCKGTSTDVHHEDRSTSPIRRTLINKNVGHNFFAENSADVSTSTDFVILQDVSTSTETILTQNKSVGTSKMTFKSTGSGDNNVATEESGTNTWKIALKHRGSSPIRTKVKHVGLQVKATSRNVGISNIQSMKDQSVGTPQIILRDKNASTPHINTAEKETTTTQVHTMHRAAETDTTIMFDKAVDTNITDVTKAYLDAVGNDTALNIRKITRATCTPKVLMITKETSTDDMQDGFCMKQTPQMDSHYDRVIQGRNEECATTFNIQKYTVSPRACKDEMLMAVPTTGVGLNERQLNNSNNVHIEEGFHPIEKAKGKHSFFRSRRFSLPKAIIQRVDKGMNTKSIVTEHKGTCTPPPDTRDIAVTTEFTTRVDDKITQCISKLKNVSQMLDLGVPNVVHVCTASSVTAPVTTAATPTMVCTSADTVHPSPSVRPRFSFFSSILGRRQSEGDIRKVERKLQQQESLARKQRLNISQMVCQGSLESLPEEENKSEAVSFQKPKLSVQTQLMPRLGSAEELAIKSSPKKGKLVQTPHRSSPKTEKPEQNEAGMSQCPPSTGENKPHRPKIKMGKPPLPQSSQCLAKTAPKGKGERKRMPITRAPSPNHRSSSGQNTKPDAKPPLPPSIKNPDKGAKR